MTIHSVTGPLDPEELTWVSMHEHVFCDGRAWLEEPAEPPPAGPRVVPGNLGWLRWNIHCLEDNLMLDDPEAATEDLRRFRAAGGSAIAELSVVGLGRRVSELPEISRASGVHILVGTGVYIEAAHPPWVKSASLEKLAGWMEQELRDGIEGTGIRPALIGEIGTSTPVHPDERRVLSAAARAGAATGAAVNVHLDPRGTHALEILELLTDGGISADRVIFSHMDERLDLDYHRAVLDAGAVVEYDTFGSEFYWGADLNRDPTDAERLEALASLIDLGFASQCVVGCDVWMTCQLTRNGGPGYAHLPQRMIPALREHFGVGQETIDHLVRDNPRRLLDRP